MSGHDCPIRIEAKEEKADHEFPRAMKSSGKADLVPLPLEHKYPGITPVKEAVSLLCFSFIGIMDDFFCTSVCRNGFYFFFKKKTTLSSRRK